MKAAFKELGKDKLAVLLKDVSIAIITATEVEKEAFYKYFMPLPDHKAIIKVITGKGVYYIGRFGLYNVLHIHSGMGSVCPDSSLLTIQVALERFRGIKYCIMGGIAFGMNERKQKKGDVIVSQKIIRYECVKVKEHSNEYRADIPHSSLRLFSLFSQAYDWKFYLGKGFYSKIISGDILSGEKLIDNLEFRNELKRQFPKVLGGEMEGGGLASACELEERQWIVVKAISDMANGKKDDKFQPIAAAASYSLIYHVLSSESSFGDVFHYSIEKVTKQQQECMIHAEKGSPLWTVNQIRSSLFPRFIQDLSIYNEAGYDEDICISVRKDLACFADEIRKLPKLLSCDYSLEEIFDMFMEDYVSWNNVDGTEEINKNERIKCLNRMRKARSRLAKAIRYNQKPISIHSDKMNVDKVIIAHKRLSEEYPDIFPKLRRAVNKVIRKRKQVNV